MSQNKGSIQESIFQAIEIVDRKILSELAFDITETATIVDDSKKDKGVYTVKSTVGDVEYEAYTSDTSLTKDTTVYVTIPKGNYNEQKLIVSKKTSETEKPINFTNSFDSLIEMVDISIEEDDKPYSLLANGEEDKIEILKSDNSNPVLSGYSRFGIKANFRSWIPEAISGNYGLRAHLYSTIDSTVNDDVVLEDSADDISGKKYIDYIADLDISKMYGNPYDFEGYYSQEYVFDISHLNNIEYISLEFYQDGKFKDKDNKDLPTTTKDTILNETLPNNLFVKNIQLSMGYDTSEITNEFVQLYSLNNSSYTGNTADIKEDNKKEIKLRWVHIDEKFGALDIADASQSQSNEEAGTADNTSTEQVTVAEGDENNSTQEEAENEELKTKEEILEKIYKNSKIEWFRYKLGAPSATTYSGAYWEHLDNNDDKFSYTLEPDVNLETEQLKVIITYPKDSTNRYYSNIIVFNNEQDVSGANAGKYLSALTIKCDDDSYGNYFIYDQGYGLLDQSQSKEIKTVTAHFDLNKLGDEINAELTEAESICWTVPSANTMINIVDEGYNIKEVRGTAGTDTNGNYIETDSSGNTIFTITTNSNIDTWKYGDNYSLPDRIVDKDTKIGIEEFVLNEKKYKRKIIFSKYEIVDNKLEIQVQKVVVYTDNETQPLRVYDNLNKQISVYEYELKSDDITKRNKLKYRINSTYSPSYNNNIIQCSILKDGLKYSTSKELSFGIMGTADTDYTLVLDFDDNKHAMVVGDKETKYSATLRLYDQNGKEVDISQQQIIWELYSGNFNEIQLIGPTKNEDDKNNIINYSGIGQTAELKLSTVTENSIIVLQASLKWGDRTLIAYLPIPLTNNSKYDYIKGPTVITYLSDGSINYDNQEYQLIGIDGNIILPITSTMIYKNTELEEKQYLPSLKNNSLEILGFYVDQGNNRCAVKLTNKNGYWINPILIFQNRYPSRGVNKWDGKTIEIDKENGSIYSTMLVAGVKNSQGQFSGVMLGDMGKPTNENSVSKQTGLYGFHNGAMSYAFKDDGTGFIGKSGSGRIEFNGDSGTIYSSNWADVESENGMHIDLATGTIEMKGLDDNKTQQSIIIDASASQNEGWPLQIGECFKVDWSGYLQAENAHINGVITATGGTIGGWDIDTDSLSGNGTISGGTISGSNIIGGTISSSNIDFIDTDFNKGLKYKNKDNVNETLAFVGLFKGDDEINDTTLIGIQALQPTIGMAFETSSNMRFSAKALYVDVDVDKQYGIYARFA